MALPCANPTCPLPGVSACARCLLVAYCSKPCQTAHWPTHKADHSCGSPLAKPGWRPEWEARWVRERVPPAFVGAKPDARFGRDKYLWGNVPAVDVVNLRDNEGVEFKGPLNILFAASGDIRNLIKSIVDLPDEYTGAVNATLNDRDIDVVARNILLLLLLFNPSEALNPDQVAENALHVWYSALLPASCVAALAEAGALVTAVCDRIASSPGAALRAKTWTFTHGIHAHTLRVVLSRDQWFQLRQRLVLSTPMTAHRSQEIRRKTMLNPTRVDYLHRGLFCADPKHRVPMMRFREDGILLPFSYSRAGFDAPNPTLYFDAETHGWPMPDSSDPADAYTPAEVREFPFSPARNDLYGKVYALVKSRLECFRARLRTLPLSIKILCLDVEDVPGHLERESLARIEVSNITDNCWVGTPRTLYLFMDYLQPHDENPHAALVALYMNAVEEAARSRGITSEMSSMKEAMVKLGPYLEGLGVTRENMASGSAASYNAVMLRFLNSEFMWRDNEKLWQSYVADSSWSELCDSTSLTMDRNTIVPAWPYAAKLKPGQPGAQQEFNDLWMSNNRGDQRYVEWRWASS